MKVFIAGDIIGSPGREILKKFLNKNLENYDFVIVNGENSAGGFGITGKVADDFFSMGVDIITSGNHIWDKKESMDLIHKEIRILRPLNYPKSVTIGRGSYVYKTKNGEKIAVMNLLGRVFMSEIDSPFERYREEIEKIKKETNAVIVDFHAEATSEKCAFGWYTDGEISLVYGTHTHVLTADNRILPNGTGYITDIGMTGGFNGIIGMKKEAVLEKFLTSMPRKFEVCDENIRINGIEVEIDGKNGKCTGIKRIDLGMSEI